MENTVVNLIRCFSQPQQPQHQRQLPQNRQPQALNQPQDHNYNQQQQQQQQQQQKQKPQRLQTQEDPELDGNLVLTRSPQRRSLRSSSVLIKTEVLNFNLPKHGLVGSYGGGDAFGNSRMIYCEEVTGERLRNGYIQYMYDIFSKKAHQALEKFIDNETKEIMNLPKQMMNKKLDLQFFIQVSSQVYGYETDTYNMMYHGWLFQGKSMPIHLKSNISQSILVGIHQKVGIEKTPSNQVDMSYLTTRHLVPAEQHVHLVEGDSYWHFGTDMAKFKVMDTSELSGAFFVAVDLEKYTMLIELVLICPSDMEDSFSEEFCKSNLFDMLESSNFEVGMLISKIHSYLH